jgi:hypothetical protein
MSATVIYGADGMPAAVVPPTSSAPSAPSSPAVHTDPKSDTPQLSPTEAAFEIAQTASEAGCYEFITESWEVDEHHQDLTRSIRSEADPRYVPLICKRVYRSPAKTEIVRRYHVIGKYIEFPAEGYEDANVKLSYVPRGFPFPPDKIQALKTIWSPWDTRDEKGKWLHPVEHANNTPPEEVEIGPWLLEQMRAVRKFFDSMVKVETQEDGSVEVKQCDTDRDRMFAILEAETNRDQELMAAAREEARYRMRHNWKQLKEAADNGRWSPEPPEASQPFVDLGHRKEA